MCFFPLLFLFCEAPDPVSTLHQASGSFLATRGGIEHRDAFLFLFLLLQEENRIFKRTLTLCTFTEEYGLASHTFAA